MNKNEKIENMAWDIYINDMKSKWVSNRVTNQNDFKKCDEYDEYIELSRNLIKQQKLNKII